MRQTAEQERKRMLRQEARARLISMSALEQVRLGEQIESAVWSLPEMETARSLLIYASIPPEVPTDAIAAEARRRGIEVVYPRCLPGAAALTLHAVSSDEDLLVGGRFAIREPAPHCPPISVPKIDVALIPGLAWDRNGGRLGRGAGFYDRLLATPDWRARTCGLFFSLQEFPFIPLDPWDMRLDAVVTELETVRVVGA